MDKNLISTSEWKTSGFLLMLNWQHFIIFFRFWYFLRQLRKFKKTTGEIVSVEEIKEKIKKSTDKKEIKRYKNMISAYGSRLHKREDVEQLREQVSIRNQQISVMLQVLKQDLPQHQYMDIVRRIRD